jgi:hypothetical protein
MNHLEKTMLVNAHPVKFTMNVFGMFFSCFYLWDHELRKAFLIGGLVILIGTFLTKIAFSYNLDEIAKTRLGRAFHHLSQRNGFACYVSFHILGFSSCWFHEFIFFLPAVLFLSVGLMIHRIDKNFITRLF